MLLLLSAEKQHKNTKKTAMLQGVTIAVLIAQNSSYSYLACHVFFVLLRRPSARRPRPIGATGKGNTVVGPPTSIAGLSVEVRSSFALRDNAWSVIRALLPARFIAA